MAMNCAILSYDGTMFFGFSGDVHAAPDLRRMEKLLMSSFQELFEAAMLGSPKGKRKPRRAKRPRVSRSSTASGKAVPISISRAATRASEKLAEGSGAGGKNVETQLIA